MSVKILSDPSDTTQSKNASAKHLKRLVENSPQKSPGHEASTQERFLFSTLSILSRVPSTELIFGERMINEREEKNRFPVKRNLANLAISNHISRMAVLPIWSFAIALGLSFLWV